jgi:hypothetical protein
VTATSANSSSIPGGASAIRSWTNRAVEGGIEVRAAAQVSKSWSTALR